MDKQGRKDGLPERAEPGAQPHAGHRERLKERFLAEGIDHFESHNILELILFYAVPRRDTNELAHRLLAAFGGSLVRVLDAPVEELCRVDGVGRSTALLLKLFPEVCRRYLTELRGPGEIIGSSRDAAKNLIPLFFGRTGEMVVLLCLDAKGRVLFCNPVFEGTVNAAAVGVRRVVEIAVRYNATDLILAHNHPGGLAIPSEQDILVTKKVADALKTVGVSLLDHLIVADTDWVSLAATPTLRSLFPRRAGFAF